MEQKEASQLLRRLFLFTQGSLNSHEDQIPKVNNRAQALRPYINHYFDIVDTP